MVTNDDKVTTIKLSKYGDDLRVWTSKVMPGSVVFCAYDANGKRVPAIAAPAEWDAFVAAGNRALGRAPSDLADRIATEQGAPINLFGICAEGREEDVYGEGYAKGRADAAAMVREAGPTVPRAAVAALRARLDAHPLLRLNIHSTAYARDAAVELDGIRAEMDALLAAHAPKETGHADD